MTTLMEVVSMGEMAEFLHDLDICKSHHFEFHPHGKGVRQDEHWIQGEDADAVAEFLDARFRAKIKEAGVTLTDDVAALPADADK